MEKQEYDPEIEYDKIISWIAQEVHINEGQYITLCDMISEYGLAMYVRGGDDASQIIDTRIKQITDEQVEDNNISK